MAADWLTANGFQILRRNWRHGRYEVDLIAGKEETIHIVEVKCRQSNAYGPPEQSVSRKKIEHLLRGAQGWLLNHPGLTRIQYDVLAITLQKTPTRSIFCLKMFTSNLVVRSSKTHYPAPFTNRSITPPPSCMSRDNTRCSACTYAYNRHSSFL